MSKREIKSTKKSTRMANVRESSAKRRRIDERTLNTKVRSSKIDRILFFRKCRVAVRALVILGVLAGAVVGARVLIAKAFFENPQFALTELQVTTDGALTEMRIIKEAGVTEGINLLGVDIENIRSRLTKLAQVESVKVERQLPNRLIIEVVERHPIAWLSCPTLGINAGTSSGGYLLDARGTVIDCEVMLDEYARFPVIRVRSLSRIRPGHIIESDQVVSALQILRKTQKVIDRDEMEIVVIDLPTDYSIQALFSDGARINFGMEDLDRQVGDLRVIMKKFTKEDRRIKTLDLMPTKNIPVTFEEGAGFRSNRRQKPKSVVFAPGEMANVRSNPVLKREMAARGKSESETETETDSNATRAQTPGPGSSSAIPASGASSPPKPATLDPRRHKRAKDIEAILRDG